jgi:hypothetical protein
METEQPENMEEIELNLTEEQFLVIAKMAHANDITFNKQVEIILRGMMEEDEQPSL